MEVLAGVFVNYVTNIRSLSSFFVTKAIRLTLDIRATTSKEGSRRANYPIPTRGGSDNKY